MKGSIAVSTSVAVVTFIMGYLFYSYHGTTTSHDRSSNRLLTPGFIKRLNYAMSRRPATFRQLGFEFSRFGFGCVEILDKNKRSPVAFVFEDQNQEYVIGWLKYSDKIVHEEEASEIIENLVLIENQDRITVIKSLRAKVFELTDGISDQQIEEIGNRCEFE